ncbi:MAG TPA: NADH-quinone oxidoreductase subunit N [Anaerolineales bacterium]|nr:NADH-quinone oxidoreductase subunit N [Anaerolineales bacterium]
MTAQDLSATLPLLLLTGWACVLMLLDAFIPAERKDLTAGLAALGIVVALGALAPRFGQTTEAFGGMLVVDGFASFLDVVFLGSGLLGIALAYDYLKRMGIERGEYYSLLLFSICGMMLMGRAADLIIVFLALELLSIPLYVLSGFAVPRLESEEAALKYFLLGAFATGFVVYGIALTYGALGSTRMEAILATVRPGATPPGLLLVGMGLILIGFGFKVAAVPFHMWTPDVYQGAPSSVTAFMSVGAKAGGFAALLRLLISALPDLAVAWAPAAAWISALTMVWANFAAIAQPNVKRMLAYSSIAHAGYILMALAASASSEVAPQAASAALFYLAAYAVTNLGAWGVVLSMEKQEGAGLSIDDYAGLGQRRPGLALAMTAFMLSLTGVPPTIGFVGKFFLFGAAIQAGLVWLALIGVITSLVSAYYYLRVVVVMYMRPGEPEARSERWLSAGLGLAALATVVFGILPGPLLALAERAGLMALVP